MKYIRYVYRVSMQAFDKFLIDDGWAIASHIALSALMALFPFLIVITALAGFSPPAISSIVTSRARTGCIPPRIIRDDSQPPNTLPTSAIR